MKIDNVYNKFIKGPEEITQAQNGTQKAAQKPAQPNETPTRGDRVEISQTSKDIRMIDAVLKTTPEVRTDKVQALKEQIESGTYQVDAKKVANAMMADLLKELA